MLHQWVYHFLIFGRNCKVSGDSNLYSRPLKMMPLCSFRISGPDYAVMQHHIQEEQYPKLSQSPIALQKCVLLDLLQASVGKMLPKIHSE
jgi:hypothetical protein